MIKVTEDLWITSDDLQWIVGKPVKKNYKKNGITVEYDGMSGERFFSNLKSALGYIFDQDLKNCESFKEIVSRIDELNKLLQLKYTALIE